MVKANQAPAKAAALLQETWGVPMAGFVAYFGGKNNTFRFDGSTILCGCMHDEGEGCDELGDVQVRRLGWGVVPACPSALCTRPQRAAARQGALGGQGRPSEAAAGPGAG